MEKLSLFFNKIKEITFFQRIFGWGIVRALSYEAYEQFKLQEAKLQHLQTEIEALKHNNTRLQTELEGLKNNTTEYKVLQTKIDAQISVYTSKIEELNQTIKEQRSKIERFENIETQKQAEFDRRVTELNKIKETLDNDRQKVADERVREKDLELERNKKTWSEHESFVQQRMKTLCQAHTITFVEKVPFAGNPDNTVEICGEYIIFDAKSPANDDLSNFPKYIKLQTESVKKYAKQESVKRDIFLVVPSNTIHLIPQHSYNMSDYNVYVITVDALEPILLSLKKIEEYEFAEQLSPEERDDICRVIGKFAHTTKRKIQIDQFFANQFIELLVKCKNDLPDDILKSVIEYEKAEKLNPPTEKRAKQILTEDLKNLNQKINDEAAFREIEIPGTFDDIKRFE